MADDKLINIPQFGEGLYVLVGNTTTAVNGQFLFGGCVNSPVDIIQATLGVFERPGISVTGAIDQN